MQQLGHIIARCPNREEKDERKEKMYKEMRDDRDYKKNKDSMVKGKKSCYIVEEETDTKSKSNDEEIVYIFMKENYDEDEKTKLISNVRKSHK